MVSISYISNVENPGESAINVFSSNSYNLTVVVVFFPLSFFELIFPSKVKLSSNKSFNNVDLPTPELPENTLILFFKTFLSSYMPMFFFAFVSIIS